MKRRLAYLVARLTALLPRRLLVALSGEPPIVVGEQHLDAQLQLVLALRKRRKHLGLVEPTVEAGRRRYRRESTIFNLRPTGVGAVRDLEVRGLPARHYAPREADGAPLTVYFHGGGFVIGDLDTHDEPCRILCRRGRTHVLSVAYRLAPEHPYPAAIEDAVAAFRWARANARSFGADPQRVAVGGDSAGANLAAVAAMIDTPFAQLLIYPAVDERTERPSRRLFDKGFFLSLADHDAFSKHYAPQRLSLLDEQFVLLPPPPTVIAIAGFDILRDEGEAYAAKLRDAGAATRVLRFPSLGHGFVHMTAVVTAARRALMAIADAWRETLADGARTSGPQSPEVSSGDLSP